MSFTRDISNSSVSTAARLNGANRQGDNFRREDKVVDLIGDGMASAIKIFSPASP